MPASCQALWAGYLLQSWELQTSGLHQSPAWEGSCRVYHRLLRVYQQGARLSLVVQALKIGRAQSSPASRASGVRSTSLDELYQRM